LDKHGINYPQPTKRNTLLSAARQNYESISKKVGDGAAYPGDWLYDTWSTSELKAWLNEHGHPVTLPTTRSKLIASVRRNARLASLQRQGATDSATAAARAAKESMSDSVFDSWSDSQIKEWADRHGIKIPQGSKRNELLAIARRHKELLVDDGVYASVSSIYGAATSKAGNQYARASDDAQMKVDDAFERAINSWSETRLKAYLDSRGVPVPQAGKRDELLAKVRLQKHKAATGYSAWTFDAWTTENLR
jgi:Putative nuclear envelope organisation protein